MTPTDAFLVTAFAATAASYLVVEGIRDHLDDSGAYDHICCDCGYLGLPLTKLEGRLRTEILLWTLLVLPGYAYSVWRINTRHPKCAACASSRAVPARSPIGRRKARAFRAALTDDDDVAGWDYCELMRGTADRS